MRKPGFTPLRAGVTTSVLAVLIASAAGFPRSSAADPFTITRWTVDGGGVGFVQAVPYILGGTLGQPDAGLSVRLNYTLGGGFWGGGSPSLVGVGDPPEEDPGSTPSATPVVREVRIHPAAPNPLLDDTRIAFELPDSRAVEVRIFDLHGAQVRVLADGPLPAGRHTLTWDARDAAGRRAAPGLYFVRVQIGSIEKSLKLVVMR